MPNNEQPQELTDYNPTTWTAGKIIKASELRNIETQVDILTDQVLNIDNRLVEFQGATSSANGVKGIVPAPEITDKDKYLKGDGSWETPAIRYNNSDNTILEGTGSLNITGTITGQTFSGSGANLTNISGTEVGLATSDAAGAMSSADFTKLYNLPTNDGLAATYVAKSSVADASGIPNADTIQYGLVKVGNNINVDNGTISVPLATDNSFGVIQLGTGLTISNGIVSNDLNIKNGTGDKSIRINNSGVATGQYSCAEGYHTQAKGSYSHAEGQGYGSGSSVTDFGALGTACHSEGCFTVAKSTGSHAEGYYSSANGIGAHVEGYNNTANGKATHAEGLNTIANHKSQHVFGEYNISDSNNASQDERGNYIEIVGNGTSDNSRSNARTLNWDGNEWLAGSLTASNIYRSSNINAPLGMTELWVNSSPGAEFQLQTIPISNLSNYNSLYIVCRYNTQYANGFMGNLIPNVVGQKSVLYAFADNYSSWNTRSVTINSDGLQFSQGVQHSSENSGEITTFYNSPCIPQKIYGIN